MLHIPIIRENKKEIIELLKIRNFDASKLIDTLLEQDDSRKETQKELDELLAKSNQLSRKIGELYKGGEVEKANQQKTTSAEISFRLPNIVPINISPVSSINFPFTHLKL